MNKDLIQTIEQILGSAQAAPDGTPFGKKMVVDSKLVDSHTYLYEMFTPRDKFGTNNPKFDDGVIASAAGNDVVFVATPDGLFCIRVDPDSEIKFSVVRNPSESDTTAELMAKSDMIRVGRASYTSLSVLFDNILGVVLKLFETGKRTSVIFSGVKDDLAQLYIKIVQSERFRKVESQYGIVGTVKGKYIIIRSV